MSDYGVCQYAPGTEFYPCKGKVTFAPDPYAEEIHGDSTEVWMCEEHRDQSAADI